MADLREGPGASSNQMSVRNARDSDGSQCTRFSITASANHTGPAARQDSGAARFPSNVSRAGSRTSKREAASNKEIYPEQNLEKGIVGWEGQDDPENPR